MNLLALQVVTNTTGVPVEYVDFIIQMAPFSIFYMACSIMMVFIIRGKERLQNEESLKTVLEERLKEMGPVSADEIKIFLVLSIGFIAFVIRTVAPSPRRVRLCPGGHGLLHARHEPWLPSRICARSTFRSSSSWRPACPSVPWRRT